MKIVLAITIFLKAVIGLPTEDLGTPFGIQNRITGGNPAQPAQFPFHVLVQTRKGSGKFQYNARCGGSLISHDLVLTAAHCLERGLFTEIYLGTVDLSKNDPNQVFIQVPPENYIVHEKYDTNGVNHDIALVKLPQKVNFNKHIQTINLPRKSQKHETFVKTVGWISGWGKTGDNKSSTDQLQFTRRWILPDEHCNYFYPTVYQKEIQICLDGSRGISSCDGDSGGPLFIQEQDGSWILVGITSYAKDLCEKGYPTVYTRVTAYLDWIVRKSGISLRY